MKKKYLLLPITIITLLSFLVIYKPNLIKAADASITTIAYRANTMNSTRYMNVYLPAGYSTSNKYPVLYLLHGGGGNHDEWTKSGNAKNIIDSAISPGQVVTQVLILYIKQYGNQVTICTKSLQYNVFIMNILLKR